MRVLLNSILLLLLTSNSAAYGQTAPAAADITGCYRWETERGWSSLRLSPNGKYVAYATAGLGLLAKATGGWELEGQELVLGTPREVRGWLDHPGPPVIASRDDNGQIILTGALGKFVRVPRDGECGP